MKNCRFLPVILVVLVVFAAVLMTGCLFSINTGNGKMVSEERSVQGFNSVMLEGVGDINIYPGVQYKGQDYAVVVTADSNLQDRIEVTAVSSVLYISEKWHVSFSPTKLEIDVYVPELRSISLKGVGNFKVYSGNVSSLDMTLSGVGNIDAQNYQAQNVSIKLSGTGDIKTWATHTLTGKLSGVGDVKYRGNPVVSISKSGVGKISHL